MLVRATFLLSRDGALTLEIAVDLRLVLVVRYCSGGPDTFLLFEVDCCVLPIGATIFRFIGAVALADLLAGIFISAVFETASGIIG